MIRQVSSAELADTHVLGNEGFVDVLQNHPVEQLAAEMETGCRHGYSSFVCGVDRLVVFGVFRRDLVLDPFRNRNLSQGEEMFLEVFVRTVIKESQSSSPGGGVVDDFGDHALVFAEVEFVADADFAGGFDEDVPQFVVGVELAQEEDFDAGAGLLFVTVEAGGEDACVVVDHDVAVVEVFEDVFEYLVLNLFAFLVEHHKTGFITMFCWQKRNMVFWEFEFEL